MIEKIIDWSSKNRFIVLVIYLMVAGYGIYSLANLPVDAIPDLSENQVIVYTEWMGRSPQIIEDQITYPIVSSLQGLAEVKAVRASSMFGMSFVFVIFEDGIDLYFARGRVLERLSTIQTQLPQGVKPILGPDGTGVGHIYWYTVEGEGFDLGTLRQIQDWFIKYKLSSIDGVAEVASIGGFVKQFQIDVHPEKLKAYDLNYSDVIRATFKTSSEVGGKLIEINDAEYFIRGKGYVSTIEEIEETVVKTTGNNIPILLKHVATVQMGPDIRRGALEKDGKGEVVGGIIVMRHNENASKVIEKVKQKIAQIQHSLPEGVTIVPSYDRSTLINEAIGTLERALIEASVIVSIVVIIFLLHLRSIIRILIEIPIAVLISFSLMYLFNITSNIMSLGGIILAIGVIVDSSIVMVENAYRNIARAKFEKGFLSSEDYKTISINSAKQVGRAIFFSELIILTSFLPLFLLTGQEGKLFKPLVFTKTFAMLGSAIVGISLIPVLMTFLMRGKFRLEEQNPVTNFFHKIYELLINWVLNHRKTTIALNLLALLITIPMILRTGSEFMPPLDEGSLLYMPVTLPNASITEVNRIMKIQNQIIKQVPEVSHVLGKLGRAETATDNAPLSMIETIILLKPKNEWRKDITKEDIIQELDKKLQIPGVTNGWTQPIINRINMLSTGVRTDIGLKIFGTNTDTLEQLAIKAEQIIRNVNGVADVVAERNQKGYYIDIIPKRDISSRYGIIVKDLNEIIELIIGGENLTTVVSGRIRIPMRVRLVQDYRDNVEELKKLLIPIPSQISMSTNSFYEVSNQSDFSDMMNTNMMKLNNTLETSPKTFSMTQKPISLDESLNRQNIYIPLSHLAEIKIVEGPAMINSENGMLRSIVYFNARGKDMMSVINEAEKLIKQNLKLPEGYSIEWSGQFENKIRAQKTLMIIIPITLLTIFVLLFLALKNMKEALIVMLSVPFALIGGVYMIYILNYNFSVAVWVGFIALYGIAVETGVVMVVYLHESLDKRIKMKMKSGNASISLQDIYEATIEGSVLRLRPKLMTVATSMVSLIPVMWSTGTGADVMKPLTAPMIGGLLTSAIHVLVVTPVLFYITKSRELKREKLQLSKISQWMYE